MHRGVDRPDAAEFIQVQRSSYVATVSEADWPCGQPFDGKPGFHKVLDCKTQSFTDVPDNRQFIRVSNLARKGRVALTLFDQAHRQRLKLLGRLSVRETVGKGLPQREVTIQLEGFDWNCVQHVPMRIQAEDVKRALDEYDERIAELGAELAWARRV